MRPRGWLGIVVAGALAFTLLVSVTSVVSFAYRSPSLHVAVETAAALISLLAAQLVYGRFRRSLDRRDLLLTAALLMFAGSNGLFLSIPAIADLGPGSFVTWAPEAAGALGAALFAAGAFGAPRVVGRPTVAAGRVTILCGLGLLGVAVATAVAGDSLPTAIAPRLPLEASWRPSIADEPSVLAVQLVVMALLAAAAIGFARRAEHTRDPLTLWLAIGATLGAFAQLNYSLVPSLHPDYFYTADVLRLGFFVALLIGGIGELRVAQRELEQEAAVKERRILAREIHDGIAQDLAFIVQQAEAPPGPGGISSRVMVDVATAARRALDESRAVIAALLRPTDEPLAQALTRVAEAAAGRWDTTVETIAVDGLELSGPTREALLRIVGEAVTNGARHGRAQRIQVVFAEQPELQVRIVDDGVGFDPGTLDGQHGRHGIMGMRERAEEVGAQLRIDSRPGKGTVVIVVLP